MKKTLSLVLAIVFAFGFAVPAFAETSYLYSSFNIRNGDIRATAHRGYSSIAPENTLPAFRLAGEYGFWGAECDIHLTSDGVWVVSHDTTIDRMTDGEGAIADMTYEELMSYTIDAGSNIADYPDLKTPTLVEYLDVCKEFGLHCVIEIKDIPSGDYGSLARILNAREEKDRFVIISFDRNVLLAVRPLMPETPMYLLESPATQSGIDFCLVNGIDGIDFSYITDEETVRAIEDAGLRTMVWTVDDLKTAETYYGWGVRDITTNSLVPQQPKFGNFLRQLVWWFRDLFARFAAMFSK
ncbi:MAG: glycerophosphodiester phosphodiesterase [Clostridia bacterium]|nr:glycerophosphodiester phosphodiesterase [Clostridia bacterium]